MSRRISSRPTTNNQPSIQNSQAWYNQVNQSATPRSYTHQSHTSTSNGSSLPYGQQNPNEYYTQQRGHYSYPAPSHTPPAQGIYSQVQPPPQATGNPVYSQQLSMPPTPIDYSQSVPPQRIIRRTTTQHSNSSFGSLRRRLTGRVHTDSANSQPEGSMIQQWFSCYSDMPWETVEAYLLEKWPTMTGGVWHELGDESWIFKVPSPGLTQADKVEIMRRHHHLNNQADPGQIRRPETPE